MSNIKKRWEVPSDLKWDLSSLYSDEKKWEEDFNFVSSKKNDYFKYEGKLNNAYDIYNYFVFDEEISKKADALFMYAALRFDEDTTNFKYQSMKGKIEKLIYEISENSSFVIPELMKLSKNDVSSFMKELPELSLYEREFDLLLRRKPHILSLEEEKILSGLSKVLNSSEDIASYLRNADMTFGNITDGKGNEVKLTNTNYSVYITDPDRNVRKQAFCLLHKEYKKLQNTFACAYSNKVACDNKIAKLRGYDSAKAAALFGGNIDLDIYDNLIKTVSANLDVMDKYFALKKEVMNLDELHLYDIYTDLIASPSKDYTFDEAKDIVLKALSILGEDYVNTLKKAFSERWIDVYPNEGKKGGAYSWGCYTSNPYVLLNFNGKFSDVSTLAHELGHSLHSYYSHKNNPYIYHHYKIFVAEVASQVNELILSYYLINNTDDLNEKLFILDNLMNLFKGSIVRQTMFAEFEDLMHVKEEDGEVLTSEVLSDNYYNLYKKYSGNNVICDDDIRFEWEKIPHFYYDFYVYQYSTGLAAACYIANKIMNGEKGALENYLKFLSLGGSMDPVDELKVAGVDMSDPAVIQSAMDMFKDVIDEFKENYKILKKYNEK